MPFTFLFSLCSFGEIFIEVIYHSRKLAQPEGYSQYQGNNATQILHTVHLFNMRRCRTKSFSNNQGDNAQDRERNSRYHIGRSHWQCPVWDGLWDGNSGTLRIGFVHWSKHRPGYALGWQYHKINENIYASRHYFQHFIWLFSPIILNTNIFFTYLVLPTSPRFLQYCDGDSTTAEQSSQEMSNGHPEVTGVWWEGEPVQPLLCVRRLLHIHWKFFLENMGIFSWGVFVTNH